MLVSELYTNTNDGSNDIHFKQPLRGFLSNHSVNVSEQ